MSCGWVADVSLYNSMKGSSACGEDKHTHVFLPCVWSVRFTREPMPCSQVKEMKAGVEAQR